MNTVIKQQNQWTTKRMNEERKQGKNKGKNKQTGERPKNTSTKGHKMNTCTRESMEEWKEEKGKTNNGISDMRTQYNILTL